MQAPIRIIRVDLNELKHLVASGELLDDEAREAREEALNEP